MPGYFYHIVIDLLDLRRTQLDNAEDGAGSHPSGQLLDTKQRFRKLLSPFSGPSQTKAARNTNTATHGSLPKDYKRRGVSLQDRRLNSIDIEGVNMTGPKPKRTNNNNNNDDDDKESRLQDKDSSNNSDNNDTSTNSWSEVSKGIGDDRLGGLVTKAAYIPLDKVASTTGKDDGSIQGIVHLYRDTHPTSSLPSSSLSGTAESGFLTGAAARSQSSDWRQRNQQNSSSAGSRSVTPEESVLYEDCKIVCVLAVPTYLSFSDFLGFVGEQTRADVSHFRMIKTARANRYMVLMKFRSSRKAKEWQKDWNGTVFNSMEPETCHVVFVKSVEVQADEGDSCTFPDAQNDFFIDKASTKPLAPPTPSLLELPTCPVCLERMDETTGLLTILCQHVFHCTCLEKWKGSGCPVCRYTQPQLSRREGDTSGQSDDSNNPSIHECSVCHSQLNLWVCLICANVGCGRYDEAHAFAHFRETEHAFAMDLDSQRVWDYVGDGYVHRIVQNKADGGKLVELPSVADRSSALDPDWSDAVSREKFENVNFEYTHMLISQLDSQRMYFEEKVERAVDKASQASAAVRETQEENSRTKEQLAELQTGYDKLNGETLPVLERDNERAGKRAEKFEQLARRMEKQWQEEKSMNGNLLERVKCLSAEVETLKQQNADLRDENRDLSFFISGAEKLKDQGEDIVEGTVSLPDPPSASSTGRKKKKGKK